MTFGTYDKENFSEFSSPPSPFLVSIETGIYLRGGESFFSSLFRFFGIIRGGKETGKGSVREKHGKACPLFKNYHERFFFSFSFAFIIITDLLMIR